MGKYNIHRFINLLIHLGVPHAVIFDDDNHKNEHKEINQLIEYTKHAELTLAVNRIPDDLEAMLGMPSAASDHRKPQHVLYQYDIGKIDASKIQELCSLIDTCLPVMSPSGNPEVAVEEA